MTAVGTDRAATWQSLLGDEPPGVSAAAPALFAGDVGQRLLQRAVPVTEAPVALFIRAVVRSGSVRVTAMRGDAAAPVLDLEPSTGTSVGAALGLAIELPGGVTQLVLDATAPTSVVELIELAYRTAPPGARDSPGGDGVAATAPQTVPQPDSGTSPPATRLLEDDFVGPLLSLAIPDETTRSSVVTRLEQDGASIGVWRQIGSDASTTHAAEDLQYALRLAPLVEFDLSTIGELLRRRGDGQPVGLDELAGLEAEDWTDVLAASDVDAPADAQTTRAGRITRAFEQALPSAAFNRRAVHHGTFGDAVTNFLGAHLTTDLGTDHLDRLASQESEADGSSPSAKASEDVRAVQRLYKLSPRHDHVSALHAAGFRSANQIARAGRASFMRRHADALGGIDAASQVFERAARVSLAANALVADHGPAAAAVLPRVLQTATDAASGPGWEELFGDQLSFAGVAEWRSVFSQAAYLTDLFGFLRNIDSNVAGETALDELLSRRPDLQWMTLGEANTNVSVLYVDLVNELLESAVLSHPPPPLWVTGYPDGSGSLPGGATATTGDEGWQWVVDPGQPTATVTDSHASPPVVGQHQHGSPTTTRERRARGSARGVGVSRSGQLARRDHAAVDGRGRRQ